MGEGEGADSVCYMWCRPVNRISVITHVVDEW